MASCPSAEEPVRPAGKTAVGSASGSLSSGAAVGPGLTCSAGEIRCMFGFAGKMGRPGAGCCHRLGMRSSSNTWREMVVRLECRDRERDALADTRGSVRYADGACSCELGSWQPPPARSRN